MDDESYKKLVADHLPKYRDELTRRGLSKADIDEAAAMLMAGSEQQPTISTLEAYQAACVALDMLSEEVPRDDTRSSAAIQLGALEGAMIEFEEAFEADYGRRPPTR